MYVLDTKGKVLETKSYLSTLNLAQNECMLWILIERAIKTEAKETYSTVQKRPNIKQK